MAHEVIHPKEGETWLQITRDGFEREAHREMAVVYKDPISHELMFGFFHSEHEAVDPEISHGKSDWYRILPSVE